MDTHKFRIDQSVTYKSRGVASLSGVYTIIALLPPGDDGEFNYRIRHSDEIHERVVVATAAFFRNGKIDFGKLSSLGQITPSQALDAFISAECPRLDRLSCAAQ